MKPTVAGGYEIEGKVGASRLFGGNLDMKVKVEPNLPWIIDAAKDAANRLRRW